MRDAERSTTGWRFTALRLEVRATAATARRQSGAAKDTPWVDARWTTGDARGLWPAFGAFGGPPNEGLTKAHQNVQLAVAKQSKLQSRIALPMIKSQERLGPLGPQP